MIGTRRATPALCRWLSTVLKVECEAVLNELADALKSRALNDYIDHVYPPAHQSSRLEGGQPRALEGLLRALRPCCSRRFGVEVDEDTFAWNTRAALDYHRQVIEQVSGIAKAALKQLSRVYPGDAGCGLPGRALRRKMAPYESARESFRPSSPRKRPSHAPIFERSWSSLCVISVHTWRYKSAERLSARELAEIERPSTFSAAPSGQLESRFVEIVRIWPPRRNAACAGRGDEGLRGRGTEYSHRDGSRDVDPASWSRRTGTR